MKINSTFFLGLGLVTMLGCGGGNSGYTTSEKSATPYALILAGDNQKTTAGQPFAVRLKVKLTADSPRSKYENQPVIFQSPETGPSGTFTGGGTYLTVLADANGVAETPIFIANGIPGSFTVTATAFPTLYEDKPGTVTFRLQNQ